MFMRSARSFHSFFSKNAAPRQSFNFLLFLFAVLSPGLVVGQTIATALPGCLDAGISSVGVSCGGGGTDFGIVGAEFAVRNVDGAACCPTGGDWNSYFEFPAINISSFSNVQIQMDYRGALTNGHPSFEDQGGPAFGCTNTAKDNGHDQIVFFYSVNGGPFVQSLYVHGTTVGDFTGSWNQGGLNGNTLTIRVYASNKSQDEAFYFSNLVVSGTPKAISAGPDRTTCGGTAVTLGGSGTGSWSGGAGSFSNPSSPTSNYTPSVGELGSTVTLTFRGQPATATCGASFPAPQDQMTVTVTAAPNISPIANVSRCNSYTLPAITGTNLTANRAYFTGSNGTGTRYNPGQTITSSATLFAYDGVTGCSDQEAFTVTITPAPSISPISNVSSCNSYTLPGISGNNLTGNQAYFTGTNGTGTRYNPGQTITSSTTLYAYDGTPGCSDEESFFITITAAPQINAIANVVRCASYTLPNISGANLTGNQAYYTGTSGTGTRYNPGQTLTSSVTLFAYDGSPGCSDQESFSVTITPAPAITPIANVSRCNSYTLPAIAGTNLTGNQAYFTGANGTGTRYNAGQILTSSISLFAYDGTSGCSDQEAFSVTITQAPNLNAPGNVVQCASYLLPSLTGTNLTGNQAYFTGANGTGTRYTAGQTLTSSVTLFAYDGVAGCSDQETFSVTITPAPSLDSMPDFSSCNSFTLPPITGSNLTGNQGYYSGPNGTGTRSSPGEAFATDTALYVYDGVPGCSDQDSFLIGILVQPDLAPIADTSVCGAYSLPPIQGNNLTGNQAYYTETGGNGTQYVPGQQITDSLRLYAYDGTPGCSDEEPFDVAILPQPALDSIPDTTACGSLTLLAIEGSNLSGSPAYYTGPEGTGTRYLPGMVLTDSVLLYAFDTLGPCRDQRSFQVAVTPQPEIQPVADITGCGFAVLPAITGVNLSGQEAYYASSSGLGTRWMPGDTLVASDTLYAFDRQGICISEDTVRIAITPQPVLLPARDTIACEAFELPAIQGAQLTGTEAYFTGPGGTGNRLNPGAMLASDTLLYIYDNQLGCISEDTFRLAIVQKPLLDSIPNVLVCGSYSLPFVSGINLSGGEAYYNQPGGLGDRYEAGEILFATDTLYAFDSTLTGCFSERSFVLTITPGPVPTLDIASGIACFGDSTGALNLAVTGGVPPYAYLWNDTTLNGQEDPANLKAGIYAVTISDSGGCEVTAQIQLSEPAPLTVACTPTQNTGTINGSAGEAQIQISGGSAPFLLTVAGPVSSTQSNILPGMTLLTGLRAGVYSVTLVDSLGCEQTCSFTILEPACALQAQLAGTDPGCSGEATGAIAISLSNGAAPYQFDWSADSLDGIQNPSGIQAGLYQVTIRDSIGCEITRQLTLTDPAPLALTCGPGVPVSTVQGADGRARILVSGGNPAYSLALEGPKTDSLLLPPSGDTTLQGLVSGPYSVLIRDQNGCVSTCSFQIEEPVCTLTASIVLASRISCFQANNGVLAAQAANGTGPFAYSWTGPSPVFDTDTLRALQPGTYALTITDAIGCRDSATFLLAEPSPLAVSCTVLSEVLTVGGSEGRARIAFSGGTGAIRIDWGGPQPGITEQSGPDSLIIGGLQAGSYALVFADSNNCQETCGFSISDPVCAFQVDAQSRQPSCSGASDGQIVVIPSGGTGPYSYSWSNGAPAADTLSMIPSGVFSVTATDAIGCKDSIQITLAQPEPLAISCTPVKAVGRIGGDDGEALIALGGGTAPYQVVVSGPTNNTFTLPTLSILRLTDLRAGTYAVEVTDGNGCISSCGFSLSEPPCSMTLSLTPTPPLCSGTATARLTPVITQGIAPFVYNWSVDSLDNQPALTGISAGTYSLTVTDSIGCTASNTQTISDPPLLDLQCGVPVATTRLGGADGSISVTVLGGAPPYQLILSGAQSDTIQIPAIGAVTVDSLRQGSYSLLLTDRNGCPAPACAFAIEDPVCDLDVVLIPTHPSCTGGTDGRIQTQITSGSARYIFDWSNNILDGIANPSGLAAGQYSLTVTDLRGCMDTALVRLNAPPPLQIACMVAQEPTRPGGADGIIQVQAGGGTGRLNIQLLGPGQGARSGQAPGALTISQLPGGNYRIILTDSLSCTTECSLTLTAPPCMLSATAVAVNPSCAQDSSGSIQIQATGQHGALSYAWNTGDTLQALNQLNAGVYTVVVVDEALCRDTVQVALTPPPPLVLNAHLANGPTGLNRDDARVALAFLGGRGPYQVQWSGPVSGQSVAASPGADTLSGLPAGNYTFTLTDSLGCSTTRTLSIPAFTCNLAVALSSFPESCEGAGIQARVSGNLGTVAFDWSDDALDGLSTLSNRPSGLYAVTVTDPSGCSASASLTVATSGPIRAVVEGQSGDCPGDSGSLTVVQIQGGKSPYSIRIGNGNSRVLGTLPQTLRNLQPGSMPVVLTSSDGCLFDTIASIPSVPPINLELGPDLELQKGDTVELAAAVDFDPQTIQWLPGTGLNQPNTLTPLASPQTTTTYQLRVTDANGCPVEDQITLFVTDDLQVFFPSAFSPNGDQMNDFFTGFSGGSVERIDLLRIYDRWGEMLFETTNIIPNEEESGWNGQFRNEQAKPGVYIFNAWVRLKGGSTRFMAGEVLLVR